jgi:protein-disulfide isomerase
VASSSLAPSYAPRTGGGKVLVVEFADYQCPACASVAPILNRLATDGSITLVYRNFPLPQHPNAIPAARAAEAAGQQGKFWEMHDLLFRTQSQWGSLPTSQATSAFEQLAASIGVDASWLAAYESSATLEPIDTDATAARDLELNSTPSLYIDGVLYRGALSESAIRAALPAS